MIRRIYSDGPYEGKIGYCRAVVADGWVHVSGTVGQGDTVAEQCQSALDVIADTLAKAGCGLADVVRVRYILPDAAEFEACWPMLTNTFSEHPPAATMIEARLIDPKYRIEIEVTAKLP